MQLYNLIKEKLQSQNKNEIVKELGYKTKTKGLKTLEKFLNSKDLHNWLLSGYYDLVNGTTEFTQKLCISLNINEKVYIQEIEKSLLVIKELNRFRNSYIWILTDFKRKSETIMSLSIMQGKRIITINKEEFVFKTFDEIIALVSTLVKNNYISNNGKLVLWGNIQSYVYSHYDGNQYLFDTKGNLIKDDDSKERINNEKK